MRLAALLGVVATAFVFQGTHVHAAPCNRNAAWQDRFPAWSPTGSTIAFVRQLPGCSLPPEVVGVVEPGRQAAILARDGRRGSTAPPTWSSTGAALAWGTTRDTIRIHGEARPSTDIAVGLSPSWGGTDIGYTIENEVRLLDGAPRTLLTDYVKPVVSNGMPAWSPDRTRLALGVLLRAGGSAIAVLNADGSGVRFVASGANQSANPTWSPDGSTIAFETNRDGDFEVYSVNSDGRDVRNLTRVPGADDLMPAWHGDTIAFISNRGKPRKVVYGYNLWTMSADGGGQRERAGDLHPFSNLSWSPDGTQIAFASGRECLRWGIYAVELATDRSRRLTNPCRFTGTARADVLRGTPFDDFLAGRDGNDTLIGGAGRDVVTCGSGRDTVIADRRDRIAADCERIRRR